MPRLVASGIAVLVLALVVAGAFITARPFRSADGDRDILRPVVSVPTRWSTASAADLATLVDAYPVVFIGTVQGKTGQRAEERILDGIDSSLPIPISLFQVHVDEHVSGGIETGATVIVQQPGGVVTRSDGTSARVVLQDDEPILAGQTYLFFATLAPSGVDALVTAPYSRFVLDGGSVTALPPWRSLGVVQELSGLTLTEAQSAIQAASADPQ